MIGDQIPGKMSVVRSTTAELSASPSPTASKPVWDPTRSLVPWEPCEGCPRRGETPASGRVIACGTRGNPLATLAVIAETPGTHELVNETGVGPMPLVGGSGVMLRAALGAGGVKWTAESVFCMNAVDCFPMGEDGPTTEQKVACRSRFLQKMQVIRPQVMLLLGNAALEAVTGFRGQKNSISHWDGYLIKATDVADTAIIPSSVRHIIPVYHPAAIARTGNKKFYWWQQGVVRAARALRDELYIIPEPTHSHDARGLDRAKIISIDLETYRMTGKIRRVGLSWRGPGGDGSVSEKMNDRAVALLKIAVMNTSAEILDFNANFDIPILYAAGFDFTKHRLVDPLWGAPIVDPDAPGYTLNQCFAQFCDGYRWKHKAPAGDNARKLELKEHKQSKACNGCGAQVTSWSIEKRVRRCESCSKIESGLRRKRFEEQDEEYNLKDAAYLHPMWTVIKTQLISTGQLQLFDHRMRVLPKLIEMHVRGIRVDTVARARLRLMYEKWAKVAQLKWEGTVPGVNMRSFKQMTTLLYTTWELPKQWKEERKGGVVKRKLTADKVALQALTKILKAGGDTDKARALGALTRATHRLKFIATYIDVGDRAHPTFAPGGKDDDEGGKRFATTAATGRIIARGGNYFGSKTAPLQQAPKLVRSMYTADPGMVLVSGDWDSQELRILAARSRDAKLIEQIRRMDATGRSFHQENAELLHIDKTRAKNGFYGWAYGAGWKTLLETFHKAGFTQITAQDTKGMIQGFKELYTGVSAYHARLLEQALEFGYIEDGFGQRRYFYDPRGNIPELVNFEIQSGGSGMEWVVAPALHELAEKHGGNLLLLIHDENLAQVPEQRADAFAAPFRAIMEQEFPQIAPGWSCPVKIKVGRNWRMKNAWLPGSGRTRSNSNGRASRVRVGLARRVGA